MAQSEQLLSFFAFESFLRPSFFLSIAATIAIVYATTKLVTKIFRIVKQSKELDEIAGAYSRHWFYGHMQKFSPSSRGFALIEKRNASFPTMFNHWIGPFYSSLHIHHSDVAKTLLSSGAPKNKLTYDFLRPWIGDGLLTSKGKKWQRNRHLLTPAFHFNILKSYVDVFNNNAKVMLDKWSRLNGKTLEVSEDVSLMTLDTMLQCAMSSKTNCQHVKGAHPYIKAVNDLGKLTMSRAMNPFFLIDFIFVHSKSGKEFQKAADIVHQHAEQIITERRRSLETAKHSGSKVDGNGQIQFSAVGKNQLDFLDILLQTRDEDGKGLSDSEIRDEVDTFLFEGHDTTASGISWALYNLAKYPEFQEKCRQEVLSISDSENDILWDDLGRLTYLTMFIKESMRIYPPVFAIGRQLEEALTLRSRLNQMYESVVGVGANISLQIYFLHRNEKIWENPLEFIPERFTKENIAKRSPHAYLPFSAGSRNCIGQNFAMNEMKICLALTLKRYQLYLDETTPEPKILPRLILQSENGISIKLKNL